MSTFGPILHEAESLGITYVYNESKPYEPFELHYKGHVWNRASPGSCRRLLTNLIELVKSGKFPTNNETL